MRSNSVSLRVALAQINCVVGDLEGNASKIRSAFTQAERYGAQITAFPELAICGYPPEDLLLKPKFIEDNRKKLEEIARAVTKGVAVVGFVDKKNSALYNAASVIANGKSRGVYHKALLPNYGVFDEKRYFTAGTAQRLFKAGDLLFGVNICEDIWSADGPTKALALAGARLIININASPYHVGKVKERQRLICRQAKVNRVAIAYVNMVGGQDELVFDGQSMVVNAAGRIIAQAEAFKEDLLVADLRVPLKRGGRNKPCVIVAKAWPKNELPALPVRTISALGPVAEVYEALLLGLKDYVSKNGFTKVVIGLSGGIDSALVATLAADALGKENVTGVFMPSRYSSKESEQDARSLADNLGIKCMHIPIEAIYTAYLETLTQHFAGSGPSIAEENIQARIRGNILMALSNKFGWLVLTTGNKSEMSTGYATLYGDMAGGFAVIKDVPKMLVYELARLRNAVIPERIFTKAPTAELKPNQKDSDTLPEYAALDAILKAYIEEDKDAESIVAQGFDRLTVAKVQRMVDMSEYKRRQAPPGIKITPKAFGRDRRMPITNRYGASQ